MLFKLYALFLIENEIFDAAKSRWEIAAKGDIPLETWHKISWFAHSFSCNVAQYLNYNIEGISLQPVWLNGFQQ